MRGNDFHQSQEEKDTPDLFLFSKAAQAGHACKSKQTAWPATELTASPPTAVQGRVDGGLRTAFVIPAVGEDT